MDDNPERKMPTTEEVNHRFFKDVMHAHEHGLTMLNEWEKDFIRNNDNRPSYSDEQQAAIDRLMHKHLPRM